MKPENKQRFSIRKYAIGAASVLIGFAFQAQAVAAKIFQRLFCLKKINIDINQRKYAKRFLYCTKIVYSCYIKS